MAQIVEYIDYVMEVDHTEVKWSSWLKDTKCKVASWLKDILIEFFWAHEWNFHLSNWKIEFRVPKYFVDNSQNFLDKIFMLNGVFSVVEKWLYESFLSRNHWVSLLDDAKENLRTDNINYILYLDKDFIKLCWWFDPAVTVLMVTLKSWLLVDPEKWYKSHLINVKLLWKTDDIDSPYITISLPKSEISKLDLIDWISSKKRLRNESSDEQ